MTARTILGLLFIAATRLSAAEPAVDFSRDVRPILSNKCFQCHGPDEQSREGELRLDIRDGLFRTENADHAVVIAGQAEASELFRRVTSDDADSRMPPADSDYPRLTAAKSMGRSSAISRSPRPLSS